MAGEVSPTPESAPSPGTPAAGGLSDSTVEESPASSWDMPDDAFFDEIEDASPIGGSVPEPPPKGIEAPAPVAPLAPPAGGVQPAVASPPAVASIPPSAVEGQPAAPSPSLAPEDSSRAPSAAPLTVAEAMNQHREAVLASLSEMYQISDADLEAFDTDLGSRRGVLKKLAGQLHFNAVRAAINFIETEVPHMMEAHTSKLGARATKEASFLQAWPQLSRADLPLVNQYGLMFLQANPGATLPQFTQAVGTMVAAQLGKLTPQVVSPAAHGNGAAQPPQVQRAAPAFAPAANSAPRPATSAPVRPDNPWGAAVIALDMLDELE